MEQHYQPKELTITSDSEMDKKEAKDLDSIMQVQIIYIVCVI